MIICTIATASALRGALTIYKQFISHLEKNAGDDEWHIFVDVNMPMPTIPNVEYHVCHTKEVGRILFDIKGFKSFCRENKIVPDVIFSLQNTNVKMDSSRNIIYYHQPLPLFKYRLSLSDHNVIGNWVYTYFYPLYVKMFLDSRTFVAVQTETIKDMFCKRYKFPLEKVGVYFPNVENVNAASISPFLFEDNTYNFVYPAMVSSYKEHITLAYAMRYVRDKAPDLANKIRIHLTLKEHDQKKLWDFINKNELVANFVFHGNVPHEQIMSMLKSCNGLLFPSVVETLGLPLLEAASLGTPVIANDMGYVHDVLGGYEGLKCVKVHAYDEWADCIIESCHSQMKFMPFSRLENDSWDRLFVLIRDGIVK